jgi:hypothetical protein
MTFISIALHVSAFISVTVACAYTCKAIGLSYFTGAVAGAVSYLILLLIVWE